MPKPLSVIMEPTGWWAVTSSADVTRRKLIGSRDGAQRLAEVWETRLRDGKLEAE
jgi:hypothetical protein